MQQTSIDYSPIIVLVIFIFLIRFALKASSRKLRNSTSSRVTQYQKIEELFSPAERSFLGVLEQALNVKYKVFGKVRLGDIIEPKRKLSRSHFYSSLNRINKKHVDFVICQKDDLKIIGIVELDDKSHNRSDRKKRDEFVDKVLSEVGIPILHFPVERSYKVSEVRSLLVSAFSILGDEDTQDAREEHCFDILAEKDQAATAGWNLGNIENLPVERKRGTEEECPDCGSVMRARKVSKGPHQGKLFFVCIDYPKCKTVKRVAQEIA
ncbi:MAG: DUF2726 domain-containing protein [Desulfuromonadales bacterium]|nr:DUF2726 domain-containing protein [Desulfuromonadales bacterium]